MRFLLLRQGINHLKDRCEMKEQELKPKSGYILPGIITQSDDISSFRYYPGYTGIITNTEIELLKEHSKFISVYHDEGSIYALFMGNGFNLKDYSSYDHSCICDCKDCYNVPCDEKNDIIVGS